MTRHLVVVLGDQLDHCSAALEDFDPTVDVILQMEVREEASYIPQHKLRLAFFFASMRHFRDAQRALGRKVIYRQLDDPDNRGNLAQELQRTAKTLRPAQVLVVEPGDFRVRAAIEQLDLPLKILPDRHFLCAQEEFRDYATEHPHLLLENFYRWMRRRHNILLEPDGSPVGGAWNYDARNRASLGKQAPPIPHAPAFRPDPVTREVLTMVEREFPESPGSCENFDFPVSHQHAHKVLNDFVAHRLPDFGRYQDAMRGGESILFHSKLSGVLNLHLISPREILDAVIANPAKAPLNSVEGFVRQVLGWREYVRGVYWQMMPAYALKNALQADLPVPRFFWTGETDMRCLHEAVGHTMRHAYAHHIERLMVLGLFCLLLGVKPYDVHRWHLSMFWDAIDWVSLPNVIGMSQHADGGLITTKPYVASGSYINRMSDHCRQCRYNPSKATGEDACPFTTLYWDFLQRHQDLFRNNPRMRYSYQNLARKSAHEKGVIRRAADGLKSRLTAETFL